MISSRKTQKIVYPQNNLPKKFRAHGMHEKAYY